MSSTRASKVFAWGCWWITLALVASTPSGTIRAFRAPIYKLGKHTLFDTAHPDLEISNAKDCAFWRQTVTAVLKHHEVDFDLSNFSDCEVPNYESMECAKHPERPCETIVVVEEVEDSIVHATIKSKSVVGVRSEHPNFQAAGQPQPHECTIRPPRETFNECQQNLNSAIAEIVVSHTTNNHPIALGIGSAESAQ